MAPQLDETARFLYDCIMHSDYKSIDFDAMAKARGGTTKKHSLYCRWWAIHKAQGGDKPGKGKGKDKDDDGDASAATTATATTAAKAGTKRKRGAGKGDGDGKTIAKKGKTTKAAGQKKVDGEPEQDGGVGEDGAGADGLLGEGEVRGWFGERVGGCGLRESPGPKEAL